ncbi:hypothetical protein [Bartonella rattaustraliani]|uniref:hypothetical protein n=1 Tax=Bartonella rattaustraliani TaxID=481139 RepID=UPI0002E3317B|nr:hypothetical protein [Bartonella rattaustraliani]
MRGAVDLGVIRDVEEQDGLVFGKSDKVSLPTAIWDTVGVVSLLASLIAGSILGVVISLVGLLLSFREECFLFYQGVLLFVSFFETICIRSGSTMLDCDHS